MLKEFCVVTPMPDGQQKGVINRIKFCLCTNLSCVLFVDKDDSHDTVEATDLVPTLLPLSQTQVCRLLCTQIASQRNIYTIILLKSVCRCS